MTQNQKHYVVWEGWNTGIFTSWPDCQNSVQGYPAPKFKGAPDHLEAFNLYCEGPPEYYYTKQRKDAKAGIKLILTNSAVAPTLPTPAPANGSPPQDQTILSIHVQIDQPVGDVCYHYAWNECGVERNLPPLKLHYRLPGITVGWAEFDALIYGWAILFKNGLNDCFLYTQNQPAYNFAKSLFQRQGTRSNYLDQRIIRANPHLLNRFKRNLDILAKEPTLANARIWYGEKWGLNPATKSALKVAKNQWARMRKMST